MKIKEVEKRVGLKSANIRYYEKVGLLNPGRNTNNGYRDYTEEDILQLERIKTLRLINIPTDDIKLLFEGGITMESTMNKRLEELDQSEKDIKEITKNRCLTTSTFFIFYFFLPYIVVPHSVILSFRISF